VGRGGLPGAEGTTGATGGGGEAAKGLDTAAWVHLHRGKREEECRGEGKTLLADQGYAPPLAGCGKCKAGLAAEHSAAPSHWEQTTTRHLLVNWYTLAGRCAL